VAICAGLAVVIGTSVFLQHDAFADPVGQVVFVAGDVRVGAAGRKAGLGDFIYEGDVIATGAGAEVQIQTADGGRVAIGEQSELGLNKFATSSSWRIPGGDAIARLNNGIRAITGYIRDALNPRRKAAGPVASFSNSGVAVRFALGVRMVRLQWGDGGGA
jgi:hypothetical protein